MDPLEVIDSLQELIGYPVEVAWIWREQMQGLQGLGVKRGKPGNRATSSRK
jgi:hypothetical protein